VKYFPGWMSASWAVSGSLWPYYTYASLCLVFGWPNPANQIYLACKDFLPCIFCHLTSRKFSRHQRIQLCARAGPRPI
jgi:hypothetical protein